MKILYICESFPTTAQADFTGGVEARDYYTAVKLAKKHQVVVITGKRQGVSDFQTLKNIQVIRVGKSVKPEQREDFWVRVQFMLEAYKLAWKQPTDIIQGSNVVSQMIAGIVGYFRKIPRISLVADVFISNWTKNTDVFTGIIGEIMERITLRLPWNMFVSVSDTTKHKLIRQGVDPNKISTIVAGVDHQLIKSIKVKKNKNITITYAGRLVSYKRVQDLITATRTVAHVFPNIKVNIIGDGPMISELKSLASKKSLDSNITFLGFVKSHKQVIKVIKNSDIFCSPSTVEGFGLTTLEALACGVPALLADIPTTREVTQDGQGSILFKPEKPMDLADKIFLLIKDKKLYKQKSKEGKQLAKKFTWEKVAEDAVKLFEDKLKKHSQLHICLLTEFFPKGKTVKFSGGVEARTYFIKTYLEKQGHIVSVISRDKKFVSVSWASIIPRISFQISSIVQAIKTDFNVIEGSNVTCYLPAFMAAKLKRKPAIAWIPDIYQKIWFENFSFFPAISGYLLEKVSLWLPWDQIIAMSHSTKDKLIDAGVDPERISVVYGGVEVEKISKINAPKLKTPRLITLARLVKYKRIQDLIIALSFVKSRFPKLELHILGDGPYRHRLEQFAEEHSVKSKVFFHGNVAHPKAMKLLKQSRIFSLPSVVEGFGLVTAEAMACGTPYINSDIPPTREITQEGVGGFLFKPKSPQLIAKYIEQLLKDKRLYVNKVTEGKKFVKRYDWSEITTQTMNVYRKSI